MLMEDRMWKKGLVLGIIVLFLGTGVLPSVRGKSVTVNTDDNNLNNSTGKTLVIAIGLIKDKVKYDYHLYEFTSILVVTIQKFYDGDIEINVLKNWKYCTLGYYWKIGIFSNHIICGLFSVPYAQ
jgi:hypothetical protein